ncbi:MAG: exosortase W [Nitrospirota bacterium]
MRFPDGIAKGHFPAIILLVIGFTLCYYPAFTKMAIGWWEVAAYSHGFLIPPISLYLIWQDRKRLSALPIRPDLFLGGVAVILTGLILLIGRIGLINLVEYISLMLMIPGLVLLILGRATLAALFVPLCYLAFMLPFFDFIGEGIYLPFQIFSAKLGTTLLQLFGYAAYLDGLYIQLPKAVLEVEEACAGIRYLVSILAIGIPLSMLSLSRWPERVGLLVGAVLIAIIANGFRVMLIGIVVYDGDLSYSHGPFHVLQGMFVAWVGFIFLFVGAWWLSKRSGAHRMYPIEPITPIMEKGTLSKGNFQLAIGTLFFLAVIFNFYQPRVISANEAPFSFIQNMGEENKSPRDLEQYPFRLSGADQEKLLIIPNEKGHPISVYTGYFSVQKQGKELVGTDSSVLYKNALQISVGKRTINKTIVKKEQTSYLVLFWIAQENRIIADRYLAKGWDIWRALKSRRNDGAMIIVSSELPRLEEEEIVFEKEMRIVEGLMSSMSHQKQHLRSL